jgi:hypothetical protein
MGCSEFLRARVSPEIKLQAKTLAEREFLNESAWLKRLVTREIRLASGHEPSEHEPDAAQGTRHLQKPPRQTGGCVRPMLVRLGAEDRLLLDARAEARGMRPATYVSVVTRSHLRGVTPLPKEEFLAMKHSIAELASIARNINQIAKAANGGWRIPGSVREEFRAMLKICEALRDNTKALLKANETSWSTGHAEAGL